MVMLKTKSMAACQRTEDFVIMSNKKFGNTCVEVGGVEHDAWIIRKTQKARKKKATLSAAFLLVSTD